jgi:hypothetical protein
MNKKNDEFFDKLQQQQPTPIVKKKVRETATVEELLKLNFKKKLIRNQP